MAVRAAAGTPDQPTLGTATSHYRIQTTYSELSRALFSSLLEPNQCNMLLGMDFLRKAKRCLTVSINGVVLFDEDVVAEFVKQAAAVVAQAKNKLAELPTPPPAQ